MSRPDVSVIIPNRNRRDFMETAVASVLAQRDVSFELLVVDDASDNPPAELYRSLQEAGHRVLLGPLRRGPGPCRNWGAREARGSFLAFLDSDDHWLPGKLSRQLESLRASGLRVGQVAEIWYRNGVPVKPLKAHRVEAGDLYERSLSAICVSPSSVMLERDLFFEMAGFDEELFVCEDYDFWLRVAARERFEAVPEALVVKLGGHSDQLSKQLPAMDRFRLRALAKGLKAGAFGLRWEAARNELLRKASILEGGCGKRSNTPSAIETCQKLRAAAEVSDWDTAEAASLELMRLWPVVPRG